jgi:hypothetical protein
MIPMTACIKKLPCEYKLMIIFKADFDRPVASILGRVYEFLETTASAFSVGLQKVSPHRGEILFH